MLPKVQYFTLYLTRCPKSNCYLSNNISKEALFRAIFDHCPSFEITSLKMYFLNLYLIFSPHENSICIVSTKFNHRCLQRFWRISKSNTHKLLQELNRLRFLKNRNSKWSWNEWIKKNSFSLSSGISIYIKYIYLNDTRDSLNISNVVPLMNSK